MAMLPTPFDPNSVEPSAPMGADPAFIGWHLFRVVDSELKPTSRGDGDRLIYTCEVVDGPFKNRKCWPAFNIRNPSPRAQEIAEREHASMMLAAGHPTVMLDSATMHGRTFLGLVKYTPPTVENGVEKYGARNEISGYKAPDGAVVAMPTSAPRPPAPAPAASTAAPPWAQRAN